VFQRACDSSWWVEPRFEQAQVEIEPDVLPGHHEAEAHPRTGNSKESAQQE